MTLAMLGTDAAPAGSGNLAFGIVAASCLVVGTVVWIVRQQATATRDRQPLTKLKLPALRAMCLGIVLFFAFAAVGAYFYAPSWPLILSILVTGLVVGGYAYLMLAARQIWMLLAISEMRTLDSQYPEYPVKEIPTLPWWAHGFFIEEYGRQRALWLASIQRAITPDELRAVATRAYSAARGIPALADSTSRLKAEALSVNPTAVIVRHHARVVAERTLDDTWADDALIMKLQNMLLVLGLVMLALVAAFSLLGWAAPMLVGAASAVIVRFQSLMPSGKSFKGGPRWMVLLLTPLTGALAAVIGLLVVGGLADLEILNADLMSRLHIPELRVFRGQREFDTLALTLAIAFGWSAKLLDRMLRKLSDWLDQPAEPAAAEPSPPADDATAGHAFATAATVTRAVEARDAAVVDAAAKVSTAVAGATLLPPSAVVPAAIQPSWDELLATTRMTFSSKASPLAVDTVTQLVAAQTAVTTFLGSNQAKAADPSVLAPVATLSADLAAAVAASKAATAAQIYAEAITEALAGVARAVVAPVPAEVSHPGDDAGDDAADDAGDDAADELEWGGGAGARLAATPEPPKD